MTDDDLERLAQDAVETLQHAGDGVVTAESCTAGKLAAVLSEPQGASQALHGGFVAYTKENKITALGVPCELLAQKGAVCPEVALAMAGGALARSPATLAVAITGVAGPEPDEDGNPVGLVCIAVARRGGRSTVVEKQYGDIGRDAVQARAMADALRELVRTARSR